MLDSKMIGNSLSLGLFGISVCFLAGTVESREAIINSKMPEEWKVYHEKTVSVQIEERHICGGAIIADRFVLTAAHCFFNQTRRSRISILAGTNNLRRTGPPAVRVRIEKVFVSREYNNRENPPILIGDIAIVKLAQALREEHNNVNLWKLELPRGNAISITDYKSMPWIAGFGWSTYDANHNEGFHAADGRLRYADVKIMPDEDCEKVFPLGAIRTDAHYCGKTIDTLAVSTDRPHSVCKGDVGSPLVDDTGRTVYGILSRIADHCDERREPAVYTRLQRYARQIQNVMEHGRDLRMILLPTLP